MRLRRWLWIAAHYLDILETTAPAPRVPTLAIATAPSWSFLAPFVRWLLGRLFGPARPRPPAITIQLNPESPQMALTATITPAPFADATIVSASIIVTLNGAAQPAVDTPGTPITVPVKVGDVISATETVTAHNRLTSDPSDPSADVTVTDPRPAKPGAPSIVITGTPDVAPVV